MKTVIGRLAIVSISLVVICLTLTPQGDARIDPKTAIGVWLLDEGAGKIANDSSGNNNHGDIQGAKWEKHKTGSALSFNGSSDRVVIPDSDSLYAEKAWTITSWIFVNKAEGGYGHIIGKRSGAGTNYAFRTDSGCIGWDSYFSRGGWQGAWRQGNVKKDVWLYMTAAYDGKNTIIIYENGEEIGSANVGGPPPRDTSEVHIGGWTANASELLNGMLYDVAIFNIALTQAEIKNLMNNGVAREIGITAVDPSGKLATVWGTVKSE